MDHGYGSWGMDRMWVRGMDRAFKFRLAAIYVYVYLQLLRGTFFAKDMFYYVFTKID